MSIFCSVCLAVCLAVCPAVCLAVRPSVHLSVPPSISDNLSGFLQLYPLTLSLAGALPMAHLPDYLVLASWALLSVELCNAPARFRVLRAWHALENYPSSGYCIHLIMSSGMTDTSEHVRTTLVEQRAFDVTI